MTGQDGASTRDARLNRLLAASYGSLSIEEAAQKMQINPSEVELLISEDRLLAVEFAGELRIPLAQLVFRSDPEHLEVVAGMDELLPLFVLEGGARGAHELALEYLTHHDPALGRPLFAVLRNGRTERVIHRIKAIFEFDREEAELRGGKKLVGREEPRYLAAKAATPPLFRTE